MPFAGFWKRFASSLIDGLITGLIGTIAGGFYGGLHGLAGGSSDGVFWVGMIMGVLGQWIYFAAFESSNRQATLGKLALGIKVVDLEGNRINFSKASGRFWGKYISTLIVFIGYIMVAFTEKKQGLHDIMAGCLVIDNETDK